MILLIEKKKKRKEKKIKKYKEIGKIMYSQNLFNFLKKIHTSKFYNF